MADIKLHINKERDLTTITIVGTLQEGELSSVLRDYYKHSPTRLIMLDSREGSWSAIPSELYRNTIEGWKRSDQKNGRTALIFSNAVDFGIGRMLESHFSMTGHETEIECFRDMEAAQTWLFESA